MKFNPSIDDLIPYRQGLPIEHVIRRYGLAEVVKLASNESPLPPFPEVEAAICAAVGGLNRYPDGDAVELCEALAAHYGRSPDEIAVGSGTYELTLLIGDALLGPGDEVVVADPTFAAYAHACARRAAKAAPVPSLPGLSHDIEAMTAAVGPHTKMVVICNPNNPTGTYVPAAAVAELVEAVPEDVLVLLDEAYNEFVTAPDWQDTVVLQAARPNVCILRTFSKIYGLSGLRLGYALCPRPLKMAIDKVRQPFSTSRLAQVAAIEALKHQDQVLERRIVNAELRSYLRGAVEARGRPTIPSQANFMLVGIEGLKVPQQEVCEALLRTGAIVRDGNALGCPGWARVTVGNREEIDFFLDRLSSLERPTER
jgi:histidinol-phosphate aminotransferase